MNDQPLVMPGISDAAVEFVNLWTSILNWMLHSSLGNIALVVFLFVTVVPLVSMLGQKDPVLEATLRWNGE